MTPGERKEYNKKYHFEHKEYFKKHNKKYNLEHKEELKKYRLEHKEDFKKYKLEHTEELKEYQKEYQNTPSGREARARAIKKYLNTPEGKESQKEHIKKYLNTPKGKEANARAQIKYYQKHPEAYVNLTARKYVTKVLKPVILLRDSFTCQLCGTTEGKLVIHHIIPVKYDKDDQNIKNPDNLITLCPTCHKTAHLNNWSQIDINLGIIFINYTKSKKKTVEEPVD